MKETDTVPSDSHVIIVKPSKGWISLKLKEFYLRPQQILKMAQAIRTLDDLRRKFYGFARFIDGYLSKRSHTCQA